MKVGEYVEHGSLLVINHYGIPELRPLTIYGNQAESDVTIHWRPYYKPGTKIGVDEKDYGS